MEQTGELKMRMGFGVVAAIAVLSLAACESAADKQAEVKADAIEDTAEMKAD